MNKLGLLFYSDVRAEVFRILFGLKPKKMYRAEIIRMMPKFAKRSVEEEFDKLVALELLVTSKEHTLRFYQANELHPLYPELRNIVLKTSGLHDILQVALTADNIELAFVFGSLAQLADRAASDVDLMIIGDLGRRELTTLLRGVPEQVGREINSHIFNRDELARRLEKRDHFLRDVLSKPKLFIRGTDDELTKLAGVRVAATTQDQP